MPTPNPPLPPIQKTWQFANNLNPGLNGTDFLDTTKMFLLIKNALLGFASHAWTCVGSSDGTTGALDAVDRLTDPTKFVFGGGNHTWIVLEQSQINTHTQVCFDFTSNFGGNGLVNVFWSPAVGFSGGSVSARPTASDEQPPWQGNQFALLNGWVFNGFGQPMRAHVHQSSDGQCTRIFFAQGHLIRTFMLFDKPATPAPGWANPAIAIMTTAGSQPLRTDEACFAQVVQGIGPVTVMPMFLTSLYTNVFGDTYNFSYPLFCEWNNHYQMTGCGVYHNVTAGQRGRHGYVFDMWNLPQISQTGYSIPSDGSKQFIVMHNFAFPWDGGDIEMA